MQVTVVGLGKAGLPLSAVIADSGIKVVGFDINQNHVNKIKIHGIPVPMKESC